MSKKDRLIEKYNEAIDNLNLQPSDNAWANIRSAIKDSGTPRIGGFFSNNLSYFTTIAVVSVFTGAFFIYNNLNKKSITPKTTSATHINKIKDSKDNTGNVPVAAKTESKNEITNYNTGNNNTNNINPVKKSNIIINNNKEKSTDNNVKNITAVTKIKEQNTADKSEKTTTKNKVNKNIFFAEKTENKTNEPEKVNEFIPESKVTENNPITPENNQQTDNTPVENITTADTNITIPDINQKPQDNTAGNITTNTTQNESANISRSKLYYGLHYTKDFIYNLSDTNKTTAGNILGITANYTYSKFVFQLGIGLFRSKENINNTIKYMSNDLIGSYFDVDSVSYPWDSTTNYYGSVKNVYDSVEHTTNEVTENSFTYLSIPFTAGYKKYFGSRFFLTARAGFNLNILLDKAEPEITGNAEWLILNVEKENSNLVKTNWQLMASAELGYQINPIISFALEPTFKYYLKSFYSDSNISKKPYSLGVRASVYLTF